MNRVSATERPSILHHAAKNKEEDRNQHDCFELLEKANQQHPADRAVTLEQILDAQDHIPKESLGKVLNQIVLASYDLSDAQAQQLIEKILTTYPQIIDNRAVDEAVTELRDITDAILTATITRSPEFNSNLQCQLVTVAGKMHVEMF